MLSVYIFFFGNSVSCCLCKDAHLLLEFRAETKEMKNTTNNNRINMNEHKEQAKSSISDERYTDTHTRWNPFAHWDGMDDGEIF